MGSSNWEGGAPAEPDLSWMSFSPEAHGIKPALSVWPTRSSYYSSSPDDLKKQQLQEQQERYNRNENGGSRGNGFWGRSKSRSIFDESEESPEQLQEQERFANDGGSRGNGLWGRGNSRSILEESERSQRQERSGNDKGGSRGNGLWGRGNSRRSILEESERSQQQQDRSGYDNGGSRGNGSWGRGKSRSILEESERYQQQERSGNENGGSRGNGSRGRGKSRSSFDESERRRSKYEWGEEEEILEEDEEDDRLRRRRRGRQEQGRKINEDFGYDDHNGDSSFDDGRGGFSDGMGRSNSFAAHTQGRGFQSPQQTKSSTQESLNENRFAATQPEISKLPRLQFTATVALAGGFVALVIAIFLLYLSFGVTPQPPSSCEVDKLVLSFTARRIRLRGGRYISFREQGVGAERAKHSLLVVHDLLSSRFAGIPGISESLLKEYGVRLIAYDRPGYGQSDPHPGRSYNSSAQDMADIADALGVVGKFWVAGFGSGGPHVWAAIKYIPERIAGVSLFAPAGSFYGENMTRDEVTETWGLLNLRQKWMYSIARLFPALLPSLLQKILVDHSPSPLWTLGGHTVGFKDQALMDNEDVLNFWIRDVREALQQQCAFPVAEELILLVNNWGFSLAKLAFNQREVKALFQQVFGLFQVKEKPKMYSGPIHIWQGTDDQHVPAKVNEYAKRMVLLNDYSKTTESQVNLHVLEGEGHYSWFWFCEDCHRSIFKSLFKPEEVASGPHGPQVFTPEEYEAIVAAFGGAKQMVNKLKKIEEAPVISTRKFGDAAADLLYRNSDFEEELSYGIKLYVPESCDVPIDLSQFIIRAIDERIRKYIR